MPIPEEIRRVPRPRNTVVVDTRRDGPNRYAVRARKAVKYVHYGNPQPINGKVIGHIFEGRFVQIEEKSGSAGASSSSEPAVLAESSGILRAERGRSAEGAGCVGMSASAALGELVQRLNEAGGLPTKDRRDPEE